jgi:protein-disulfide isomerase
MNDDIEKIADNQMSKEPESVTIKKSTIHRLIIGVIVAAVVSAFLGGYVLGTETTSSSETIIKNSKDIADQSSEKIAGSVNFNIPPFAKFKGSDSATINLVEFGDYQCPFCKRFFDQTEPQMIAEYVDTGKAKFYFLDVSIVGDDSVILGQSAWCADEQGKYYEYHDYMYSNQGVENSGWGTPDKVKNLVGNIQGLDVEKFSQCLDSKKYESRNQQLTKFSNQLGLTGTPTMFIGNSEIGYVMVSGAQPYSVFKTALDQMLAK